MDSLISAAWRTLAESQYEQAQREFALAASKDPARGEVWLGLAMALMGNGDRFAALGAARKAVDVAPELGDAHLLFGLIQRQIGNLAGAARTFEIARHLEPANANILRLLSGIYRGMRRPEAALKAAKLALELEPSSIESLVCVADAMVANEDLPDAERIYRVVLALDRRAAAAAFGLGRIAHARAEWNEAQAAFERALELAPDDPDTRYNLALMHLRFGRYREGFADYPAIMNTRSDGARYYYHHEGVPRWNGEPLDGRRLVIAADHGLGDHLMMARFLRQLPDASPRIVVETPPPLVGLFRRNFTNVEIEEFTHWQPATAFDLHVPAMQLPCIAGIAAPSDISGEPYLSADPARVRAWKSRLGGTADVRHVGIVWHGNRDNTRERWRAAPLRFWRPLAAVAGVEFHSLQLDATDEELDAAPFPLTRTALGSDMDDTAALMTALDAIVSVDTSTIHLAGALGRPAWLANPLVSDFRWGVDGSDSPWYPSVRIVRQTRTDDWLPVFHTIAAELRSAADR